MKKIALLALCAINFVLAQESSFGVLQSGNNKFVFGQVGPVRADQYLLDTTTGRLWHITVGETESGGTTYFLEPVVYVNNGKFSTTPPSTAK